MKSKTHWLKNPNKNYLGSWDLPEKGDLVLTIKSANWENVKNPVNNQTSEKRVVRFQEKDVKPWICNEGNAKSIVKSTGFKFMEDAIGKQIALFVTTYYDRKEKETIDVVRVRDKVVKAKVKPVLLPNTDNWNKVLEALKGGYKMAQIKSKYEISKENERKLLGI